MKRNTKPALPRYCITFLNKLISNHLYMYFNLIMEPIEQTEMESPELLQKKLYLLLEQLQDMARGLPAKYQMRLPYELLSSLANSLLNETVFEIVKGLMDIQNVTEQHMYQKRMQLLNKQKMDEDEIAERTDITGEEKCVRLKNLMQTQKIDLKEFDMSLVIELDEKVNDQQTILAKAGVPGFFVTKNRTDIKVQMHLLDFILRLSNMKLN